MTKISRQNSPIKIPKDYYCSLCDYKCSKQSDLDKHETTRKHQKLANTNFVGEIRSKNSPKKYQCECGKEYKHAQSLWNHKKCCMGFSMKNDIVNDKNAPYIEDEVSSDKAMIKILVTQNQEMMKMMHHQYAQLAQVASTSASTRSGDTNNSHNNISHTNSHNKTFNLQFFLNETCKDAMNITDFVNSLKLTLADLERVGELGYAEGISQMFVRGLNELEVTKRPIHCSDLKREVIHIKDQDKWKMDANQDRLKKAIKDLSNKNLMLLDDWQKENPGCKEYDNRKNDIYLKMMVESLGPPDAVSEKKDFGKIIRTIAKNTIIQKNIDECHQTQTLDL